MIYLANTHCPECEADAVVKQNAARGNRPNEFICENHEGEEKRLFIRSLVSFPDAEGEIELTAGDLIFPPAFEMH